MGLDLRLWEADTIFQDERQDWDHEAVEEEVGKETNAYSGGDEEGGRSPAEAPGWGAGSIGWH